VTLKLWKQGEIERPVPQYVPISLVASGTVALGAAIALKLASDGNAADFDEGLLEACPMGCAPGDLGKELTDMRSRASTQNELSVASFALSGVLLTGGVIVFLLNDPKQKKNSKQARLQWVPSTSGGSVGWTF
jgi:hypothetical protein